jgi:hypothetical protein
METTFEMLCLNLREWDDLDDTISLYKFNKIKYLKFPAKWQINSIANVFNNAHI